MCSLIPVIGLRVIPNPNSKLYRQVCSFGSGTKRAVLEAIEMIRNDIRGEIIRNVSNGVDNSKDLGSTSKEDNFLEGK